MQFRTNYCTYPVLEVVVVVVVVDRKKLLHILLVTA